MKTFFTALCATLLVFSASLANAASISLNIFVNTSALLVSPGNLSAPFALDFQLTGGDPIGNSATISNFDFGGGSATTNPAADRTGAVTGDLFSTVTLTSSPVSFFNEFFQGFTPGSFLRFDVLLTTNVNAPTPDAFSFTLLDKDLNNISTTGLGDSLLLVNIDSASPRVQGFAGTGAFEGVTAVATPEPASLLLLGTGLIGASAKRWRQRRASR